MCTGSSIIAFEMGFRIFKDLIFFDAVWAADDDWSPSASSLYAELPRCKKYLTFYIYFVGLYISNTKIMINLRNSSQTVKLCSSLLTVSYINNSISDCYAYKIDCLYVWPNNPFVRKYTGYLRSLSFLIL